MLFNSIHFLVFFPVVTLVYFLLPHKLRWVWLLVASYYFYMAWNPRYALLMATSTVITYLSGLLISRADACPDEKTRIRRKKLWVALSFVSNLAILFFFKYFDFALANVNAVLGRLGVQMLDPAFDVLLPVGISFYTFQALSYTMDVYRGDTPCEKNLFRYALFVSFFPQLVAGPIERSKNLLSQLYERHTFDYQRVKDGLLLMLWGYFQKLVIADRVAIMVAEVFDNYAMYQGLEIALGVVLFAFQIYCDFSGYSDIAIGAAQVMGFTLMDNFRQPYFATSIRDFWHRWHISLSTWFRDYLYIPLGGGRCGKWKKYRNTFITFLLSGLWHGASWNFVVWGGLHGAFQIVGEATHKPKEKLWQRLGVGTQSRAWRLGKGLCAFLLVCFAWIFFRADGARNAFGMIANLFAGFNPWVLFDGSLYSMGLSRMELGIALVAIAVLLLANLWQSRGCVRAALARQALPLQWGIYLAGIAAVLVLGVYGPQYASVDFIYFQF